MKIIKAIGVVVVVAMLGAAVAAPLGPMPGFLIGGTAAEVPTSWGDTQPIHEIKLQVGTGPVGRTVIIWVVQIDGDLYVNGGIDSGWTRGIGAGGPVRMQMEGSLYELTATPVTEGKADVIAAWLQKYAPHYPDFAEGFPAPEEAALGSAVFRLNARS